MSVHTLNLSEVTRLPKGQRERAQSEFLHKCDAGLNGELTELVGRIKHFERVYEISSKKMQEQLSKGLIKETADICYWVMLLELKESVEQHAG